MAPLSRKNGNRNTRTAINRRKFLVARIEAAAQVSDRRWQAKYAFDLILAALHDADDTVFQAAIDDLVAVHDKAAEAKGERLT